MLASTFPATQDDATPAFVRDLATYQTRDFETLVLVPRVPGSARRERSGGLTVHRFRYFPARWEDLASGPILENLRRRRSRWLQVLPLLLAETWTVRRAVRRHRPDLVHVHWMLPQGLAAMLGARGIPRVVTTHGGDIYALRDRVSTAAKRMVLRHADAVTAMNADMAERLVALGAPAERVHVLPMGADVDTVRAASASGSERVPGRIVFVGRLVEKKGVAVLLEALRRLEPGGWSVEIVGDGPERAGLQARAAGLPVTFAGSQPRPAVARAYARAEIAVVPSVPASSGDQDGLPVSLLEAMAAGCAVVGSRIPGIDAAVVDGDSGLLVPPGDPAALAEALTDLLSDADRRAKLGAAASTRADDFSVDAAGHRYCGLLRAVVGNATGPAGRHGPGGPRTGAPVGRPVTAGGAR